MSGIREDNCRSYHTKALSVRLEVPQRFFTPELFIIIIIIIISIVVVMVIVMKITLIGISTSNTIISLFEA